MTVRAFVALGSNLGDRVENLAAALRALEATTGVRVVAVSQAYETEPWGVADQPAFANAVAAIDTDRSALGLLDACKRIERELGRLEGERFGPRLIDIDVLLFGDEVVDALRLTIPHPRMLERDFVVTPLLEIAPDVTLPDGQRPDPAAALEGRATGVLGRIPGY